MSLTNFFISVRSVSRKNGELRFGSEPGATRYLEVPDGETPHPEKHKKKRSEWLAGLLARAGVGVHDDDTGSAVDGYTYGDVLVFVHGYNNAMEDVMTRHDHLQKHLRAQGYKGAIVSFDWPSAKSTLNYLEDRSDAKSSALKLVKDGIAVLASAQLEQDKNKCDIDVHLLGHSTGAYVIREAFYEAGHHRKLSLINWQVSQVAFIGGDIARKSLSIEDSKSRALFEHATRITNYQNPFDAALKASNVKRLGLAPRVGRVGLPDDSPDKVVNVDCGDHWKQLDEEHSETSGNWSHSWHFDNPQFAKDLYLTLRGDTDRNRIPTRRKTTAGLELIPLSNRP